MIQRNDLCWCGSQKKWKKCHWPETAPLTEAEERKQYYWDTYRIILKTPHEIEKIRKASRLAAEILQQCMEFAKEGVTTNEINDFAVHLHKKAGAVPAPLGYGSPPFPKAICTSLNEVICHGIPNDIPLKKGDIMNIDVTPIVDGFYGDCSGMVMIGEVSEEKKRVVETSYNCLMESIAILQPGVLLHEIGDVIENIAEKNRCSVVNQFVGHGVGVSFHEEPQICHHKNRSKIPLAPGMIFTIEPMINAGVREGYIDSHDHWTARTKDHKPSAQWEHTILITENSHEILTTIAAK